MSRSCEPRGNSTRGETDIGPDSVEKDTKQIVALSSGG